MKLIAELREALEVSNAQKMRIEFQLGARSDKGVGPEEWIPYSIGLFSAKNTLIVREASMQSNELTELCNFLYAAKTATFEPMEPDFRVDLEVLEDGQYLLSLFVEDGIEKVGIYTGTGVSIKMLVNVLELREFANQIRQQAPEKV